MSNWLRVVFPSAVLAGALVLLSGPGDGRADQVILKDGFSLFGKVKRETGLIIDSATGTPLEMAVPGGFFLVDDGARRAIFSPNARQLLDVEKDSLPPDHERFDRTFRRTTNWPLPAQGRFAGTTEFDARWERTFNVDAANGPVNIKQRVVYLTPTYARIDAYNYRWNASYALQEFPPTLVRSLIYNHPDMKMTGDRSLDARRRFRAYRFFAQADLYDMAEAELKEIEKDFPEQKEAVAQARAGLHKAAGEKFAAELERARKAGRHQWARAQAARFAEEGLDERVVTRVRALRAAYEAADKQLQTALGHLQTLPSAVKDPARGKVLAEAAETLARELNPDTVGRVETFLTLAAQAERKRGLGQDPGQTPEQLAALAVTGWLLGNTSAEARPETALRLWRARQFLLQYQKARTPGDRARLQADYEKESPLPFDQMAQVILSLPPPSPEEKLGDQPRDYQVDLPNGTRGGPTYAVQLPPEYQHNRPYPVLIALHAAGEKPADALQRWGLHARLNGYVLAAPAWERGIHGGYAYTAAEHATVLDALRDLRRRFNVDSDRVFLAGWADGGLMAFDVGLSHPDLFAGVATVGARPRFFPREYWHNAQYLPFYVVDGDLNGDSPRDNRTLFQRWLPRGYPALYVEYKGRGLEWFPAELPNLFDWMGRKKRAHPTLELGRTNLASHLGEEFQSLRPTDNRFYWLGGDDLAERHVNDAANWNKNRQPATLQARVRDANVLDVHCRGFKKVTVWIPPGLVDLDRPVLINVNQAARWVNKRIPPSLTTLLDDFYQRGDKQRPYLARVDLEAR